MTPCRDADFDQANATRVSFTATSLDALQRQTGTTVVFDDGSKQVRLNDVAGQAPFDYFVNNYKVDGTLSDQTVANRDQSGSLA
jgi:hypothetical protein